MYINIRFQFNFYSFALNFFFLFFSQKTSNKKAVFVFSAICYVNFSLLRHIFQSMPMIS
ncbi:hypothetical protein GLOIN_2v1662712 [Rhizophagus irregularis DAOM 181602=DAOM 197198]|uniref:Uncharacterized protein n=1 Tax=Rhizophagus irregularis (strain DAOM 181602 / DAOM 197198 / MUCL 43194) TaxID=747089 RepID=A0A2P4PKE2_RHIID|nr:hypothetical protein GLOIN_2v1662712 [Rhizophagus irregularis DAOM 181602=DAOM 197198]POG65817.1 hypothetical protein GLOIN_2v1662712 [Rhizophagus irregularis DAOM 181602=DAOM 197198]|eukprot:XP_025172683.1 hypothetical protein GLOIN_2v1662712 [Rhizophagus irregularis DAOM 181602=DAOM 197198]